MRHRTGRRPRPIHSLARWLGLALLLVSSPAAAQWLYAVDGSVDPGGVLVTPRDIVADPGSGGVSAAPVGNLPQTSGIVGYHPLPGGDVLYASEISIELPGSVFVRRQDVVRDASGTETIELDGSTEGIPEGVAIDAVTARASGDLLLSFDTSVELPPITAGDEDVVLLDAAGWSLFFDGSAEGVPEGLDVDAAAYVEGSDTLYLSFDESGEIATVAFDDEDVLAFDRSGASWSLALDVSARDAAFATVDVVALPEPAFTHGLLAGLACLTGLVELRRRNAARST